MSVATLRPLGLTDLPSLTVQATLEGILARLDRIEKRLVDLEADETGLEAGERVEILARTTQALGEQLDGRLRSVTERLEWLEMR